MLAGKRILAVVPARSGSKGLPGKNIRLLDGVSLIGRAGRILAQLAWLDAKIISTDSHDYAEEGVRYGLAAPFLRPAYLSHDQAGAVETLQHALAEAEAYYGVMFDIVVIIEPTSPLRTADDVELTTRRLIETGADSAVAVSPLSTQAHPRKILRVEDDRIEFFLAGGNDIKARQALSTTFYWRNGVCYALTRSCLLEQGTIFTNRTVPYIVNRPIVNIDDELDFAWAEFLLRRSLLGTSDGNQVNARSQSVEQGYE